eukprot:9498647-Pyramimonas_sp.AAC.1
MGPTPSVSSLGGSFKRLQCVATFGHLGPTYGGSTRRDPRLRMNCEGVSGGSPRAIGPQLMLAIRAVHPKTFNCLHDCVPQT